VAAVFIHRALSGQPIQLFGGGAQKRDFNYVDDVVRAMLLAISNDSCHGKVFNLGASRAHSLREFVHILRGLCGCEVQEVPFPQDSKLIDIGDYYGDFSRFTDATGWIPQVDLHEGLRRTIEHYRQQAEPEGKAVAVA
jgi:nucleoside-diphosphate-sugar epimerase